MAFEIRGYYAIPSRIQTWGLEDWKQYIDCMLDDGCNFLIYWIGGGFPSKRFPETWRYNTAHCNMTENFFGAVVEYAHAKGIEVVLGFTPYAYDGVASYADAHPELAGTNPDGTIHRTRGIHDVGMWLCPRHEQSRQFMLDYVREMIFDFYPNADGLFVESSDYGHCRCPECAEHYVEREWEFVRTIADELWATKPGARMVIYPLYYQQGVAQPDLRFSLFFTPHSAHITPDVVSLDCPKMYWVMLFGLDPHAAAEGARIAADNGLQGYVVAMEAFSYTQELNGRTVTYRPFDVPWSPSEVFPMKDLIPSVMRFSYKFHCENPYADEDEYRAALAGAFFGDRSRTQDADDLLYVVSALQKFQHFGRRGSLVHPEEFEFEHSPEKRMAAEAEYRVILSRFRDIGTRHASHELGRIARWVVDRWLEVRPETPRISEWVSEGN